MAKKSRRGFKGSIGVRVLSISLTFLAIPLLIYSMILYRIDYNQYMKNLYEDVAIMGEEEINWIDEKQNYYSNTLTLINEFINTFDLIDDKKTDSDLNRVLRRFIADERITAIVYCNIFPDGRIVGEKGTLREYIGVDFSKDFTVQDLKEQKDHVIIADDPVYGHSMYVVRYVDRIGKNDIVILTIVSLDLLLAKMEAYEKTPGLSISIVDQNGMVIGTTNKEYVGKTFGNSAVEGGIELNKVKYDETGKTFEYEGKKYFADMRQIPKTETYLLMSISQEVVMHSFRVFLYRMAIFLLILIFIGGIATVIFTKRIARPMHQLGDVMTAIGSGDLSTDYHKDRFGFEINELGEAFNIMKKNLANYIEEAKRERGEKEAYKKELQIGNQIQKAILPAEKPNMEGIDVASYYSSAKEVAGDFYDYLEIDEHKTMITVADGVGKGVSSCLYSFDLRSILRTAALENRPLAELIKRANTIFCKDTKDSCNFVTLVTGYLDRAEKNFKFTNAGHLPVFVKRTDGKIEQFSTKGIALGIEEIEEVETETIPLNEGDFCVLYTDGVTEAMNENGELFTPDRLISSITTFSGKSSDELVHKIMNDVQNFMGQKEQFDDISLVVFKL